MAQVETDVVAPLGLADRPRSRPASRAAEFLSASDVQRILGLQQGRMRLETPGIGTKRIDLRLPKLNLGSSVSPFSEVANKNWERIEMALEPERPKASSLLPPLPRHSSIASTIGTTASAPVAVSGVAADFQHDLDEVLAMFEEVRRTRDAKLGPRASVSGAPTPAPGGASPPRTLQRDGPGTMSAPALPGRTTRLTTRSVKPRSASPDVAAPSMYAGTRRSSEPDFQESVRPGGNVTKALERKLNELRTNADERSALEERVEQYRRTREYGRSGTTGRESPNYVRQHAKETRMYLPELKQAKAEELTRQEKARIARAREQKRAIREEEIQHKLSIVARWEAREERIRRAEEIAAEKAYLEQRQKRWLIVLANLSRFLTIVGAVEEERARRKAFEAYLRAIVRLQMWWRPKIARLRMHKRARAMVSISHFFIPFVHRWRERRRKWAAERLARLIKWGAEKNTMLVLMQQFKARLARCVMIMWRHNMMIEAQTTGLSRYWDRVEGGGGGGGGGGGRNKKKKGGLKKTKGGLVSVSGRDAVPEHIKVKILRRDLRERRKAFRKGPLAAWYAAQEEWEKAHPDLAAALKAHAEALALVEGDGERPEPPEIPEGAEPPKRPRFRLAPTDKELKELILMGKNEYRIEASVMANRDDGNDVKWESDSDTKSVRSVRSARSAKSTKSTRGK